MSNDQRNRKLAYASIHEDMMVKVRERLNFKKRLDYIGRDLLSDINEILKDHDKSVAEVSEYGNHYYGPPHHQLSHALSSIIYHIDCFLETSMVYWYHSRNKRLSIIAYRSELTLLKRSLEKFEKEHNSYVKSEHWKSTRYGDDLMLSKQKYCMSHHGWTSLTTEGLCSQCGSAMLENEDMT